ncbi:CEAM5 protein, partial [Polypterus senegalus]
MACLMSGADTMIKKVTGSYLEVSAGPEPCWTESVHFKVPHLFQFLVEANPTEVYENVRDAAGEVEAAACKKSSLLHSGAKATSAPNIMTESPHLRWSRSFILTVDDSGEYNVTISVNTKTLSGVVQLNVTKPPPTQPSNNAGRVAGIMIGSFLGGMLGSVGIYFIIKLISWDPLNFKRYLPSSSSVNNHAQPSSASISDVRIVQETSAPAIDKGLFKLICKAEGTVNSRLWLKDSQFLSTSGRLIFSKNNETVSFSPVLQSDEASYQCAASDTNSSVTSAKYRLNIKLCEYKWYLNGREKATGESYIIGQARPVDGGRYTCMASNKMTSQTREAIKNLSVIGELLEF